nr:hypothetical protein [Tanacetum cinerariifolium]
MSARRANVELRRMEGINLKVMYDTWRRIYVTKYVQIDSPSPKANGISLLFGSRLVVRLAIKCEMRNKKWHPCTIVSLPLPATISLRLCKIRDMVVRIALRVLEVCAQNRVALERRKGPEMALVYSLNWYATSETTRSLQRDVHKDLKFQKKFLMTTVADTIDNSQPLHNRERNMQGFGRDNNSPNALWSNKKSLDSEATKTDKEMDKEDDNDDEHDDNDDDDDDARRFSLEVMKPIKKSLVPPPSRSDTTTSLHNLSSCTERILLDLDASFDLLGFRE